MNVSNIFRVVKGFKKQDLKTLAEELGLSIPASITILELNDFIINSSAYKDDAEFVKEILGTAVEERKQREELEKEERIQREEKDERERGRKFELEKKSLDNELELARITGREIPSDLTEAGNSRRKYTLPKLQFRQFGEDLKDWLPFWSQFQYIDKDEEIAPEDKFQYLLQVTIVGSRAREVVESFPPTGPNYIKAVESLKSRFGKDDLLVEIYVN
ncbi:endonuclease [Caerostris extrusa]|uniref:Endonuclease n=1 Tax=Caerostris extrusa TaxID=172846 RepID=A0AAV4U3W3_CAEEX|nr:endonuclease [Caerostris extrusa]